LITSAQPYSNDTVIGVEFPECEGGCLLPTSYPFAPTKLLFALNHLALALVSWQTEKVDQAQFQIVL
jgi:hypothetical protein